MIIVVGCSPIQCLMMNASIITNDAVAERVSSLLMIALSYLCFALFVGGMCLMLPG